MRGKLRRRVLKLLSVGWLVTVGCMTREIIPPARETTLVMTRVGASAHLQWESQRGVFYTVFYADGGGHIDQWIPLPDAIRLPGTGNLMQVSDSPAGPIRRMYRLHTE